MIVIELDFIRNTYEASLDGDMAEWPPHPARLISALISSFKTKEIESKRGQYREAIEYLEALPPPQIYASGTIVENVTVYVPSAILDPTNLERKDLFDDTTRKKREKFFPRVQLSDSVIQFIWPEAGSQYLEEIKELVSKLSYFGKSSSNVRATCHDQARIPSFVPDSKGNLRLRVTQSGFLIDCEEVYQRRNKTGGAEMKLSAETRFERYSEFVPPAPVVEIFDNTRERILVLETEKSHRPLMAKAPFIIRGIKEHLMGISGKNNKGIVPISISGHAPDGTPNKSPKGNLQYLPLGNLGPHSQQTLMGLAIYLPKESPDKNIVESLLEEWIQSGCNYGFGNLKRYETFCRSMDLSKYDDVSNRWATMTPLVFHRWPKRTVLNDEYLVVEEAFKSAGFPVPSKISLALNSLFQGVPSAMDWPAMTINGKPIRTRKNEKCLPYYHAIVEFDSNIRGPIMIGKGRFQGYGLFRAY